MFPTRQFGCHSGVPYNFGHKPQFMWSLSEDEYTPLANHTQPGYPNIEIFVSPPICLLMRLAKTTGRLACGPQRAEKVSTVKLKRQDCENFSLGHPLSISSRSSYGKNILSERIFIHRLKIRKIVYFFSRNTQNGITAL